MLFIIKSISLVIKKNFRYVLHIFFLCSIVCCFFFCVIEFWLPFLIWFEIITVYFLCHYIFSGRAPLFSRCMIPGDPCIPLATLSNQWNSRQLLNNSQNKTIKAFGQGVGFLFSHLGRYNEEVQQEYFITCFFSVVDSKNSRRNSMNTFFCVVFLSLGFYFKTN